MKPADTLPVAYFDNVYRNNDDPWNFETSDYEKAKYAASVAALPKQHYDNAFEIGCSIGVLTAMLAPKCAKLLSVDSARAALEKARKRMSGLDNVILEQMNVPEQFPAGMFDLMVVSEVGYYLSRADLQKLIDLVTEHLQTGGNLLLVHWTPVVHDYPLTGDEVHEAFMDAAKTGKVLHHLHHLREEKYRLDLFEKR